jgi:hypothetical protein
MRFNPFALSDLSTNERSNTVLKTKMATGAGGGQQRPPQDQKTMTPKPKKK